MLDNRLNAHYICPASRYIPIYPNASDIPTWCATRPRKHHLVQAMIKSNLFWDLLELLSVPEKTRASIECQKFWQNKQESVTSCNWFLPTQAQKISKQKKQVAFQPRSHIRKTGKESNPPAIQRSGPVWPLQARHKQFCDGHAGGDEHVDHHVCHKGHAFGSQLWFVEIVFTCFQKDRQVVHLTDTKAAQEGWDISRWWS